MGFLNKLISKLTKNKKSDTGDEIKTEEKVEKTENINEVKEVEKVEEKSYAFQEHYSDYFNQCEKRLKKFNECSLKLSEIQIDNIDNIVQTNNSNSMRPHYNSNNSDENLVEDNTNRYYEDDISKKERIVDITNQQFTFNRTDSNFNVNGYDPDRRSEEFMYDLNNDARIGINTDAERFNESLITDKSEY